MCLKKYKLDLFLTNTSCKIILEKIEKNDISDEEKQILLRRYDVVFKEYKTIKTFLKNWLVITKETLINIKESLDKIKNSKTKNIEKKKRYLKKLNAHVLYLEREIKNYYSDCYLD